VHLLLLHQLPPEPSGSRAKATTPMKSGNESADGESAYQVHLMGLGGSTSESIPGIGGHSLERISTVPVATKMG
jgi:hypothetical protein